MFRLNLGGGGFLGPGSRSFCSADFCRGEEVFEIAVPLVCPHHGFVESVLFIT